MCGGAIISDFVAAKRGRKLTPATLWSELDTISDLFGLDHDYSNNGTTTTTTQHMFDHVTTPEKPKRPNKGIFFFLAFVVSQL